jgi:hypothetical protein
MPATDYPDVTTTTFDSALVASVAERATHLAAESIPGSTQYAFAHDVLAVIAELRQTRQNHSDSIEAYHALRSRVRSAIADD